MYRRSFIAGASAFTAIALTKPAQASLTAHIVTGIDRTGSLGPEKFATMMLSLASVLETCLDRDMSENGLTEATFEIYYWGNEAKELIPPTRLRMGSCQQELNNMAARLRWEATNPDLDETTKMAPALTYGLSRFNIDVTRKILNIVTDDTGRNDGEDFSSFRNMAEERKITLNGMIIGDPNGLNQYFQKTLQTRKGRPSFVLRAEKFKSMEAAWRQKFVWDLY